MIINQISLLRESSIKGFYRRMFDGDIDERESHNNFDEEWRKLKPNVEKQLLRPYGMEQNSIWNKEWNYGMII